MIWVRGQARPSAFKWRGKEEDCGLVDRRNPKSEELLQATGHQRDVYENTKDPLIQGWEVEVGFRASLSRKVMGMHTLIQWYTCITNIKPDIIIWDKTNKKFQLNYEHTNKDLRILSLKGISRNLRVFGLKFLTQIAICVKHFTFCKSGLSICCYFGWVWQIQKQCNDDETRRVVKEKEIFKSKTFLTFWIEITV